MQAGAKHVSLNGVRAFEAAARLRSLKAAASELGVTAGAISHQLRQLEAAVGAKLFARRHNAVELTVEGAGFFADVSPAIQTITRARQALQRDATTVMVKASHSLAIRWLVPRLRDFQAQHPRIRVSVESTNPPILLAPGIDVALPYFRLGQAPAEGVQLLEDWASPVRASPARTGPARSIPAQPPLSSPLIGATGDDWDWRFYAQAVGLDPNALQIASRFDTDQAAVEACLSGLGTSLLTRALIERELASGALTTVGELPPVLLGAYWVLTARPLRRVAEVFVEWLHRQAASGPHS